MKVTHIPFQKTEFFSKLMLDYLEKNNLVYTINDYIKLSDTQFILKNKVRKF